MDGRIHLAVVLLTACVASTAEAQSQRPGGERDECTITAFANDITRIVLVRLRNGFHSHRAYDENNQFICAGEWSATPELNRQAAEILRNKGNDRATIIDQSRAGGM